ncbi:MAG TPA: YdcF family protein [Pseudoxanthomonas sp.]
MWFLSPLSWLLVACCLACAGGWWSRRRRLLVGSALLLGGIAIAAMTPLFANALIRWLESEREMPQACRVSPPLTAVVLAGGADRWVRTNDDYSALTLASRRRVERAASWWHEQPGRRLVLSGGSAFRRGVPESHPMAAYARELGVPAAAILTEGASKTTWESAQHLAALRPALPGRVVLITSSMHLPRAAYSMQQAGFEVCGIGADSRYVPFNLPGYLIPQTSSLRKTEDALHEIVGLVYYRWLRS